MGSRHAFVNASGDLQRLLEHRTRALEAAETRYEAVFNSTFSFMALVTLEGRFVDVNRTALEAYGISMAELRGKHVWEGPGFQDSPGEIDRYKRAFEEQRGQFVRFEARFRHPFGGVRTLDVSIRPVAGAPGEEPELALLEGRDVTELRRAEERVRHAERMEALGKLTGGVAHDFNNLLTVILGGLDIALRRPDKPNRNALVQAALEAARRGETLTRQLLAFARRTPITTADVCISKAVQDVEPLLRNAVGEAVEIDIRAPEDCGCVRMDPSQFETALLNLAVNARDAMPSGGRLSIEVRRASQEEMAGEGPPDGDFVCIVISDTGCGIVPEVLPHVFEPFFTTKELGQGTGLGLSQVYGFAQQSGGAVEAVSAPGEGATFRLLLPVTASAPSPAGRPGAPEAWLPFRTALLVEDDPAVAEVGEVMLADLGLKVTVAGSGPEARQVMTSERFDLLLTDVIMPGGVSGPDLAHWAVRQNPSMKVMLCTGWTDEALTHQMHETSWPVIQKPFDTEALREAIARLRDAPGAKIGHA